MEIATKDYDMGVIIGRFQVHKLHEAHKALIEHVISRHKKVLILLGVSATLGTKRNPMDFITRKLMIEEEFGSKISAILPIHDQKSDEVWSSHVGSKIREILPIGSAVIYGSRDSFISHYKGQFDTLELEPDSYVSATDIRKEVSKEILSSPEFRAGIIYSVYNNFPIVYSTVDVAIFDNQNNILLGKKPNESAWRFIGGFVDVEDSSEEVAAKREGREETGLELDNFEFVCSRKVQDWRYKNEPGRGIMTHLYKCKKIFGSPQPNDDISELKWVPFTSNIRDILVEEHKYLFDGLYTNICKKQ